MLLIVPFLLGLTSALAFAPVGWWPLMPLAFAGLAELIARAPTMKRALLIGWLFGIGQFALGLNWIATAFTFQAAMPAWLGWIAVVLLSLYLAVYPMLATGLAWRFGRNSRLALVLALAGGWALTEWLRATMFTGFAWNPVGVIWVDTFVRAAAGWVGTYGLSLLTVVAGGGLWWFAYGLHREIVRKPMTWRRGGVILLLFVAPELILIAISPFLFDNPDRQPASGTSVRIVQPNIGQEDKWRAGFAEEAARRLAGLSAGGGAEPRLLLWPEAAVTRPLEDSRAGEFRAFAQYEQTRAAALLRGGDLLLTGGISLDSKDGASVSSATNSVFVIDQLGRIRARYDKAHLVPYGEYLPMRPLLSAIGLSRLAPGNIDFNAGPGARTLALPGFGKVGLQICYEIIFSGQVVDRANRPDFLFNPSNDAWFGAWGPPQHLAQARLRAAEEGLPVVRSTPTGISALIDARGTLVEALPWRTAGVIDGRLPPARSGLTLFARLGNLLPLALGFSLLIWAVVLDARRRYRHII